MLWRILHFIMMLLFQFGIMQKEQYSIECPKHAVCICLSSTLLVIGPENSRHSLNQSNLRVKPIALESPAFSRAWRRLHVLALNLSFAQVGRCDYFSFGFMTLKGGAFIVSCFAFPRKCFWWKIKLLNGFYYSINNWFLRQRAFIEIVLITFSTRWKIFSLEGFVCWRQDLAQ